MRIIVAPSGKYEFLISGAAEAEVTQFLEEGERSLKEYKELVERFKSVEREIGGLDDVVIFEMFHLECHDIKQGLMAQAQQFARTVVEHLAEKHTKENER